MYAPTEWLNSLKVGDEVLVIGGSGDTIRQVTHATATQVHVGIPKFNRTTGRQIGAKGYRSLRLMPVTDERRASIRQQQLARHFANMGSSQWQSLPLTVLEAMYIAFTTGADKP